MSKHTFEVCLKYGYQQGNRKKGIGRAVFIFNNVRCCQRSAAPEAVRPIVDCPRTAAVLLQYHVPWNLCSKSTLYARPAFRRRAPPPPWDITSRHGTQGDFFWKIIRPQSSIWSHGEPLPWDSQHMYTDIYVYVYEYVYAHIYTRICIKWGKWIRLLFVWMHECSTCILVCRDLCTLRSSSEDYGRVVLIVIRKYYKSRALSFFLSSVLFAGLLSLFPSRQQRDTEPHNTQTHDTQTHMTIHTDTQTRRQIDTTSRHDNRHRRTTHSHTRPETQTRRHVNTTRRHRRTTHKTRHTDTQPRRHVNT